MKKCLLFKGLYRLWRKHSNSKPTAFFLPMVTQARDLIQLYLTGSDFLDSDILRIKFYEVSHFAKQLSKSKISVNSSQIKKFAKDWIRGPVWRLLNTGRKISLYNDVTPTWGRGLAARDHTRAGYTTTAKHQPQRLLDV